VTTETNLIERIEAVWSIDPAAAAIEFAGAWVSWGALAATARELDRQLDEAGVGPGAAVGVVLRNRPPMIAAVLGLLATDRCIVCLSAFQPAEGLADEVRQLALPVVIADPQDWTTGLVATVVETGTLGLSLRHVPAAAGNLEQVAGYRAECPHHAPLDGIALEILTSGTTGAPKRIRIATRTVEDSIRDGATSARKDGKPAALQLKSTPTVLSAPLLHVSGLFGALLSIFEGRPIVLLEKFDVDQWVDAIVRHKVRFASLPPTPMRMVLDACVPPGKLKGLLAVRSGTAPLPPETQREFESTYGVPVLIQYGATEWMGGIAGWTLDEHRQFGAVKLGSVGRPRAGVRIRVVAPDTGVEMQAGEIGLLEVVPERRLGDSQWMRTTDLASIDKDGFLYIHGRADDVIIRGGFKVVLGQVAEVLKQHAAVREAAVVGLADLRLGQVPVAAVEVDAACRRPTEDELEAFARSHLAPYQVPVKFMIVEQLPRTVSMKVSRPGVKALFEPANGARRAT
jgi:acyl-CoA synthetase (AMP-forming)/AMP-acid ligase II